MSPLLLPPPFIAVEGVSNFRPLCVYTIDSDESTRHGIVYRSAEPTYATAAGWAKIAQLGIRTVYDLRSKAEVERRVAPRTLSDPSAIGEPMDRMMSGEGITQIHVPVYSVDLTTEDLTKRYCAYINQGFGPTYADILEQGSRAFRAVFEHMLDRPGESLLFHCSAGKDRTGVLAALILKLGGCSDATVAAEYALTEVGLAPHRRFLEQHLLQQPGISTKEQATMIGSSVPDNMLAALQELRERFGGVQGYLAQCCGFSEAQIATLQSRLRIDPSAQVGNATLLG